MVSKKPLCGYLRLTVDRHGNKIGYDAQRHAILRWADYAGETIGHWYRDQDISAADRTKDRPQYEQMLTDIESGLWGGVVAWRLDRLVRLMYEFERCYRVVDDAGGVIIAIEPSVINSSDEMGRIFMRLCVMFAEMEIDTMKARAKANKQEGARNGRYHGGGPRAFGFVGAEKDGEKYLNSGKINIEHVPEEAELIREAARRIAYEGWGWTDVVKDWIDRGVRGTTGGPIHVQTLQRVLTGPRAVGKRAYTMIHEQTGDQETTLVKADWNPILDEKTWEILCRKLRVAGNNGPKYTYLLSGLVECGRCHRPMAGASRRYVIKGEMTSTPCYRCKSTQPDKALGSCSQISVLAEPVERIVIATVLRQIEETPELLEVMNEHNVDDPAGKVLDRALAVIKECDERLTELAAEYGRVGGSITMLDWITAKEPLERAKAEAVKSIERSSKRLTVPIPVGDDRMNLLRWFTTSLNLTQRRAVLSVLIESVVVLPRGQGGCTFNPDRVVVTLANPHHASD